MTSKESDKEEESKPNEDDGDGSEKESKTEVQFEPQTQELKLIYEVKDSAEVSEIIAPDASTKDRIMILKLKNAFSMVTESGTIKFVFDESELSNVDKTDLVSNPLTFNVTVKFDEIEYGYIISAEFQDTGTNSEDKAGTDQATNEEE